MSHKLLIERTFLFDKYAILDKDHLLKKLQVIPKDRSPRKGQIYCGQVESYRPTLGAAFVNVGSETVFLSTEKRLIQGEKLLLQIQREGEKNKKARATRDLSIAGEFAVLLAAGDSIIAPKKNRDDPETKRLIDKLKAHDWKYGFLLRSRCRLSDHESILAELEELQKIMNELEADKIALLYDPTTFDRIVGDLIRQYDVAEILCNDKKYCKELQWNAMSEEIFIACRLFAI